MYIEWVLKVILDTIEHPLNNKDIKSLQVNPSQPLLYNFIGLASLHLIINVKIYR